MELTPMKYFHILGGDMPSPIDKINKNKKRKLTAVGLAEAFIFVTLTMASAAFFLAVLDMWLH